MKAKDLLRPRFEVINLYPQSDYSIGEIIILNEENNEGQPYIVGLDCKAKLYSAYFEQYPHLFKKLDWWEYRTEKEMPKKVKHLLEGDVYEINKWDMNILFGFTNLESRAGIGLTLWKPEYGFIPID